MRVLLGVGDVFFNRVLELCLRKANIIGEQVDCEEEVIDRLRHYDYDAAVLDGGFCARRVDDLTRKIRGLKVNTPIIALSSINTPTGTVTLLNSGADDVVSNSIDGAELVARLQAVVRRSRGWSTPTLQIGELQIAMESKKVLVSGRSVHLTGKEYGILELLALRKNMVLTKEAFLNHLYGGIDEPEIKIIDVFICKLRKKLAQMGAPNLIGTVWGRGYTIRDGGNYEIEAEVLKENKVPGMASSSVAA